MYGELDKIQVRRTREALSREFGDEYVVVAPASGQAHRLFGDAARVWAILSAPALVDLTDPDVAVVHDLHRLGLVSVSEPDTVDGPMASSSDRDLAILDRRAVLRGGLVGAGALAVTGIQTITLPSAAQAASNQFSYVAPGPGDFPFVVPSGVTVFSFVITGAGGGGGGSAGNLTQGGGRGGDGVRLEGLVTVSALRPPGNMTFRVVVGHGGSSGATGDGGAGFGDGGAGTVGGAGGGGGGTALLSPEGVVLLVAGAGGGGGRNSADSTNVGGIGGNAGTLVLSGVTGLPTGASHADAGSNGVGGGADRAQRGFGGDTLSKANSNLAVAGAGGGTVPNQTTGDVPDGPVGEAGGSGHTPATSGNGGNGGHAVPPLAPGPQSGGGGGGGWAGGGGGQAGTETATNRSGAGGGGGSSFYRNDGYYTLSLSTQGTGASGGASGADGGDGSASFGTIP